MRTHRFIAALVTAFALAVTPVLAAAATLFTPPLFPSMADTFGCQIANVGSKEKVAQVEILNTGSGTVVFDSGPLPFAPGEGNLFTAPLATTQYVCRFTVEGRKNFRASATIFNGFNSDFVAVPAS